MRIEIDDFLKRRGHNISQAILVILCLGLIFYFMPKEKLLQYEFSKGATWTYDPLRADANFDVPKSEREITRERDSIQENFTPTFKQLGTPDVFYTEAIITLFDMQQSITGNEAIHTRIKELYNQGIIADNDTLHFKRNKECRIIVYRDDVNRRFSETRNLITLSQAYKELTTLMPDTAIVLQLLKPNYAIDTTVSNRDLRQQLAAIDPILMRIEEGSKIIDKGDIIDATAERKINAYCNHKNSLNKVASGKNANNILIGQAIFIVICMAILLGYIYQYEKNIWNSNNKFTFTILSATIFPIIVGFIITHGFFNVLILPYAIIPILLCLFVDHCTAFVTTFITIAICSIMVHQPYEFMLLQLIACSSTILSLRELSSRSQMFSCVIVTLVTYALTYFCYVMITSSGLDNMNNMMYFYFTASTVLTLLVYPLMFVVERAFGFISNVTLIELSNLNSKLLQRMSQEAPGTFQHSMQVGNLAAEAATAIGANSLEVRTGALYHDIGKLEAPIYFTENQSGGINPHSKLSLIESAQTIKKHVTDGLAMAEREGLPKKIKDFITTHHGLSKTGYFYITYKNEHPGEKIDESLFSYPGPRPSTKEQAVLMMADCVEAASRSLKEYTEENINKLVDNIIDTKFNEGELELSPLTFQDIYTIKEVFKKRLKAINHTRISYPTENKGE